MTTPIPTQTSGSPGEDEDALEGVDVREVIQASASQVQISELSKKGFKQVKVVNEAMINKLIAEAVDRVMAARAQKIGREERIKVIEQSKGQFEALARERIKRERDRITELERANEALLRETEELRGQLQEAEKHKSSAGPTEEFMEALLKRLPQAAGASDLQKSLENIAMKLERLPAGVGGGAYVDKDVVLDALFRDDGTSKAESNISKVKIKQEKAGGVKDTLAKLKAMQKGVKDGD